MQEAIAIDLGTANTLIIHNDKVVVDEPSIVAKNVRTGEVIAIGNAFGALGSDFSSLSNNPAGIGLYQFNEFTFTPTFG